MLRFFSRRRIIASLGIAVLVIVTAIAGAIAYVNSRAFEARARRSIIDEIQRRTGATVTLRDFHWSFWERRFRLEDLVLHGLEGPDHAPLAHFTRISIGLDFRTLLQHRIDLFELTMTQPEFQVIVTPDGKTNFLTLQTQPLTKPVDFEISIENFNVVNGSAILNERRIDLDLSLTNLTALLNYDGRREVLNAHLRYDGVADRSPGVRLAIPYTLSAELDYTRATVLAHRVIVTSAQNELKLQGKINQVLSTDISGKLEYTGALQVPFLNYFFVPEKFSGKATAQGFLEFSRNEFFTQGVATSEAIDFDAWHATKLSGEYTYRYPERRLTFRNFKNEFGGGSVAGDAEVENLPGLSRVHLNLHYANVDAAGLKRAFPWDPRYRIYSTASGTLNGWFEGKLRVFNLSGHVDLKSYQPPAAGTSLHSPLMGQRTSA